MEEQIATSQPANLTGNGGFAAGPFKTPATATDILALKDTRVKQLLDMREDHMAGVDEIDKELKQLGAIGTAPVAARAPQQINKPAAVTTSPNGKRGRGRPPGSTNKPKSKAK